MTPRFATLSDELVATDRKALDEIAAQWRGRRNVKIEAVDHTDSQPIRSARYPSNWHLSQDRARAVVQVLSRTVAPDRMQAEGRADSEPLAPNDTPAGRARNRRVDVTLYVSAGG